MFRIARRKGICQRPGLRAIFFVSIASAAENFRSVCASERGAPECSKQRSPGATPQVGQRTASNCFAVRSLFLICIQCDKTSRKTIPYRTLFATSHPGLSILPDALTGRVISVVQSATYRYLLDARYRSKFRRLFAKTQERDCKAASN